MTSPEPNILIVDDEPANRELLELLLHQQGYATRSASNGVEALDMIAERAPDLILLDVVMPGVDGYAVASRLKASPGTASIPIIMVTAHDGHASRVIGLNSGAEEFVSKPIDVPELSLRIRNLLRLASSTPAHGS